MTTEEVSPSDQAVNNIPRYFMYGIKEISVRMPYFITRAEVLDRIREFQTCPEDVIIDAYPKSGKIYIITFIIQLTRSRDMSSQFI